MTDILWSADPPYKYMYMASNVNNVSRSWRHHGIQLKRPQKSNFRDTVYWHGLTLIPTWINDYVANNAWDWITYPFTIFDRGTGEVTEAISHFVSHLVITYPYWDESYFVSVKWQIIKTIEAQPKSVDNFLTFCTVTPNSTLAHCMYSQHKSTSELFFCVILVFFISPITVYLMKYAYGFVVCCFVAVTSETSNGFLCSIETNHLELLHGLWDNRNIGPGCILLTGINSIPSIYKLPHALLSVG